MNRVLVLVAPLILLVSTTLGGPPSGTQDAPLIIDLESGRVSEASGSVVGMPEDRGTLEAESVNGATLSDGVTPAVVTVQRGIAPTPVTVPTVAIDPEVLRAAQEYPGVLPASMVPIPFSTTGMPSHSSGSSPSQPVDATRLEVQAISAVTPTTFSFAWNMTGDTFIMERDGVVMAKSGAASFQEADLGPGTSHNYKFTALAADGSVVASRTVPVTTPDGFASRDERAKSSTYQPYASSGIYRTFIPDAKVSMDFMTTMGCGQAGQPNRRFGGDGRGFVLPPYTAPWDATTYRTSVFLNVNWGNPAPYDIVWSKDVNPTTLYEGNTLIETRTASDAGIQITETSSSPSYATARIMHQVGNPFCAAGKITYSATFQWWRSGTFQVNGSRYPVPNHEVYGGWDPGTGMVNWWPMNFLINHGFGCLTGSCGYDVFNDTVAH